MLNELEKVTLRQMVEQSGKELTDDEFSDIIDENLNWKENKRIIKSYLKGEGHELDLKTELSKERELGSKMAEHHKSVAERESEAQYKEAASRSEDVNKDVLNKTAEIMKEITAYNPHCENITYSTIFASMNANMGRQKTNVINKGKQGVGKSRGSSELVKMLDTPGARIISGWMTPKKLFETLRTYRHALLVFDESELIMNDPQAMFLLRSALYGGSVSWQTSRGEVEDKFQFDGAIIANMNHFSVNQNEADPLFDRVLFNENNLDNQQILEKMKSKGVYQPDDGIWRLVKDRISLVRNDGVAQLTDEESRIVMEYIESLVNVSSVFNKSLSTRAISRARLVAACMKSLFLKLDSDVWALTKKLIKPYIIVDEADDVASSLLNQNKNLTRLELTELIAEKKGISLRQASRLVKASIEKGTLVAVNRSKLALPGDVKVVDDGGNQEEKHEEERGKEGE